MDKLDSSVSPLLPFLHPDMKPGAKKAKARGEAHGTRRTAFSGILENAAPEADGLGPVKELPPSEEALAELMDAVYSAGSDLKDRPLPDEIIRYKRAVRDFINYVLENGYGIEKIQGIKKKTVARGETEWKSTVYNQVRVIDRKLDGLAAAVLSGQANQLERVALMDEITGLLVDLTISGAIRER